MPRGKAISETYGSVEDLIRAWETREGTTGLSRADYDALATQALAFGHPSLAFDIANEGLQVHPGDSQLTYRGALALARAGSFRTAVERLNPLLNTLSPEDTLYLDTLSLAGRLSKDFFQKLSDEMERLAAARRSAQYYETAFRATGDYFPGINAATMSLLSGNADKGREIAGTVLQLCESLVKGEDESNYWLLATLGEASLLLGKNDEAAMWYQRATAAAGERLGDVASMRRQISLLKDHIDVDAAVLKALDIPKVVAFTGHMIDGPDARRVRFPASIEETVRNAVRQALERHQAEFGYASAACGGDIIFLEEMLARGGQIHIALPFRREDFIETSIAFAGDGWIERFESVLARATSVTYATTEGYLGDDTLFRYAADLVNGLALLRAEQMSTDPVLLAVLEPTSESKMGGTADHIQRWRGNEKDVELIDISRLRTSQDTPTLSTAAPRATPAAKSKPTATRKCAPCCSPMSWALANCARKLPPLSLSSFWVKSPRSSESPNRDPVRVTLGRRAVYCIRLRRHRRGLFVALTRYGSPQRLDQSGVTGRNQHSHCGARRPGLLRV